MAFSRKYPVSANADVLRFRVERPYHFHEFPAAIDQVTPFKNGRLNVWLHRNLSAAFWDHSRCTCHTPLSERTCLRGIPQVEGRV